jgi:hypothetical protein
MSGEGKARARVAARVVDADGQRLRRGSADGQRLRRVSDGQRLRRVSDGQRLRRVSAEGQRYWIVAAITAALTLSCPGMGRNQSDESVARLGGTFSYDPDDSQFDQERRYEPRDSLVEHRPRPVLDPAAQRGIEESPLYFLHQLHQSLGRLPIEGYALLWEDARVYSSASVDEDAAIGRLGYRPEDWRAAGGRYMPVKVVNDLGEMVEVETLSADEARTHCDGSLRGAIDAYSLRMVVPRAELVPVIHRELDHQYDDGSGVYLPPGVAVRATDEGLVARLARGGVEVPLPPGTDAVGLSYETPGFADGRPSQPMMAGWLSPEQPLRVAGRPVEMRMLSGDLGKPRWVRDHVGGGSRVFVADRCAGITLVTDDPSPYREGGSGGLGLAGLGSSEGPEHNYRIRAGATAYWANGARAGQARRVVGRDDTPTEIDGHLCFELVGTVRVCHEHRDVEDARPTRVDIHYEDSGDDVSGMDEGYDPGFDDE